MNRNPFKSGVAVCALTLLSMLSNLAAACTIGEEARLQLPFNTTILSNTDRVTIADSIIEAKKWPDVKIQAIIIAGAFATENNIEKLKNMRGENTKEYLQQLGINANHILVEKKTFTNEMITRRPDGTIKTNQIIVEFTPICKGSCAWMCDDPRVTPHSRLINR
ncbi:hypothetical protein BLA50215_01589 [Burkholderia lata]|uniref:hypothetical protein n=1 Tax=Burkholderia lata (strain ATCC 17760 / DSM 23089 / LMG 22485 / NCIMB 9086 / R18194 / 383) TaxID=482957 RepID=UPI001452DB8B|nr:hypothetical protein [Burkholderia lata]VWC86362.1 hypothetical protein BLA50215_01589 [Burkholderia lata]